MKKFSLFVVCFLITQITNAQNTFQRTYGGTGFDAGNSIQQTTDGGYIIAGQTHGFNGGNYEDVYLIKTDAIGDTLWTKTFGGSNHDYGNSIQQTIDGGYIIAGHTFSFGVGNTDVYLIKTDAYGDLVWTKTYGGSDADWGYSVQQTSDGGYIIGGGSWSFGAGSSDVYLIKTDASGDTLWTKTFGGLYYDGSNSVKQTADQGYIITGSNNINTGAFPDVYLIKTDSLGGKLWAKSFGGPNSDGGSCIHQTSDGGFIISGQTTSFGAGGDDALLIKTDSIGTVLWTKAFGGPNSDQANFVQQTSEGGYIIAGYTLSFGAGNWDVFLIKTSSSGNLIWSKTYGGVNFDWAVSVKQDTDDGYIIIGNTDSYGAGDNDVYVIRTDSLGNSGCNQLNTIPSVASFLIPEINFITSVATPPTFVTTSATLVFNGGGIIDTLCITVGLDQIIADDLFYIYPNPSNGIFTISIGKSIMKGKVEIINIFGKLVFAENIINKFKIEFKLESIPNGIYLVRVTEKERSYSRKLIIE